MTVLPSLPESRKNRPKRSRKKRSFFPLLVATWLGAAAAALILPPTAAQASPHHAHWHYLIGARANAARSFATQLYHEATAPGALHLEPARVNAADLQRLAEEIAHWVDVLESVSSDRENALTRDFIESMRATAQELATTAAELVATIDLASADTMELPDLAEGGDPSRAAQRQEVARAAAGLHGGFGRILKAHKDAELVLGIAPPTPPASATP
jgi:hypothetical protein